MAEDSRSVSEKDIRSTLELMQQQLQLALDKNVEVGRRLDSLERMRPAPPTPEHRQSESQAPDSVLAPPQKDEKPEAQHSPNPMSYPETTAAMLAKQFMDPAVSSGDFYFSLMKFDKSPRVACSYWFGYPSVPEFDSAQRQAEKEAKIRWLDLLEKIGGISQIEVWLTDNPCIPLCPFFYRKLCSLIREIAKSPNLVIILLKSDTILEFVSKKDRHGGILQYLYESPGFKKKHMRKLVGCGMWETVATYADGGGGKAAPVSADKAMYVGLTTRYGSKIQKRIAKAVFSERLLKRFMNYVGTREQKFRTCGPDNSPYGQSHAEICFTMISLFLTAPEFMSETRNILKSYNFMKTLKAYWEYIPEPTLVCVNLIRYLNLDFHVDELLPHFGLHVDEDITACEVAVRMAQATRISCDNERCDMSESQRHLKTCSNCLCVRYCSKMCQKKDWYNGHKNVCNRLAFKER